MRLFLFAGRRLRASYRNVPLDAILALLDQADEQDQDSIDCYLHCPRRRMKEEEL